MRVLPLDKLRDLLALWSRNAVVYAPQRPASRHAEADQAIQMLSFPPDGSGRVDLDYVNFLQPVPDFSRAEPLYDWSQDKDGCRAVPATPPDTEQSVYFGLRPCDAAALLRRDHFYLTEYEDPVYAARRAAMTLVVLNCDSTGPHCFCAATNCGPTMPEGPDAPAGANIVATLDGQSLLLESVTDKGRHLLETAEALTLPGDPSVWEARKAALREQALASLTRRPDLSRAAAALAACYDHPLWDELAQTCIACTGCTMLCPTCTCFQVLEEQTGAQSGRRIRCKDSCQTGGFTRNAGGHNPRNPTAAFRYRIMDKLAHVASRFGQAACVGCGRCILTCPSGIDITAVAGRVIQAWEERGSPPAPLAALPRYERKIVGADEALYTPRVAVIVNSRDETRDIRRYTLRYKDAAPGESPGLNGQFYMLTVFGVGEIAVSIPFGDSPGTDLEFCIKKVGKVTGALAGLGIGDEVGLRGPYGRGFPYEDLKGKDVLIVGSGVGLAPVRTVIVRMMEERAAFRKIAIIASATSYGGLVYADDLKAWAEVPGVDVLYALARPTDEVRAHVGLINDLLPGLPFDWPTASAILCASPRRIKFVSADLLALGASPDNIYTSLETHMRCGVGKCGHCKVGSHYMCIDGPVFTYREMLDLPPEF